MIEKRMGKVFKLFPIFFVFLAFTASGQKMELGIGAGGANYKGDLAPRFNFRNFRPGGEIFLKYNPSPFISLKAGLLIADVSAADTINNDPFLQQRNYYFKANIRELSGRLEYNFFNFRSGRFFEKWCPFLFGGVAVSNFSGKNNFQDKRYSSTQLVIPFGVGLKHYLSPTWNLGFEIGARKMFKDNLEGIKNTDASTKFQKINPYNNDMYYYVGFSVSYLFVRVKCPEEFRK